MVKNFFLNYVSCKFHWLFYPAPGKDKVPASTAKLITQPAVAYAYPGYHFAGYPYPAGFGYAYGYPITA
jgi:hypothetical protein